MEIYLNDLQFEITRRCNTLCKHCCRGEAQDVDLSKEVIDAFFDNNNIVWIHRFMLSGGEPTLGATSLEYLVDKIIENSIEVHNFDFSINGLAYDEKFVQALTKLHNYCLTFGKEGQKLAGTFWISEDQFHEPPRDDVLEKYAKVPFFSPYRVDRLTMMEEKSILPVGRALENGLSLHKLDVEAITERGIQYRKLYDNNNKECLSIPYIYISSNGNVQNDFGSMYSYDLIDTYSFGNVLEQSLEEIVLPQNSIKKQLITFHQ